MAMNPRMVLDFAQNLGQTQPLTQLMGGARGLGQEYRYNKAFNAYTEEPTEQNRLALFRTSMPLGLAQDTALALQRGEGLAADPQRQLPPYVMEAYQAWQQEPMSPERRRDLVAAAQLATDEGYEKYGETVQNLFDVYDNSGEVPGQQINTGPVVEAYERYIAGEGTEQEVLDAGVNTGQYQYAQDIVDRYKVEARQAALGTAIDDLAMAETPEEQRRAEVQAVKALIDTGRYEDYDGAIEAARGMAQVRRREINLDQLQEAASQFRDNPRNKQAYDQWLNAASELGLDWYTQTQEEAQQLSDEALQAEVGQRMNIASALERGETEAATDLIDEYIPAYREAGQEEDAQGLAELRRLIADGREDEALQTLLITTGAMRDIGRDSIDNFFAQRQDQRLDTELEANLIKQGSELELTQEEIDQQIAAAELDPELGETALKVLRYATAVENNPELMDRGTVLDLENEISDKWYTRTRRLTEVSGLNDEVQSFVEKALDDDGGRVETGEARGVWDIALINRFQRMIDPATVRENDIRNLETSIGAIDQVRRWANKLEEGSRLSDPQRQLIGEVSKQILSAQRRNADDFVYPALREQAKRLAPLEYGTDRFTSIFGDYTPPDERPEEPAEPFLGAD